jgi:cyclase
MLSARVIPCLLLQGASLVKTVKFRNPVYIGDPINAMKIFNDLEVDELTLLDITATKEGREPHYDRIRAIASEAFMPIAYGGGVTKVSQAERLFKQGCEKVIITSAAANNPSLLTEIANAFGSQSVVAGIDIKRSWLGKTNAMASGGTKEVVVDSLTLARRYVEAGAGEILLNDIDRDGTMKGYDEELISRFSSAVGVPVVACGGAGSLADIGRAISAGASGAAAGSFFIYRGPHKAVLINYPTYEEIQTILAQPDNHIA